MDSKRELVLVIKNYFVELEKKQSSEQIKEVDKKGLWNADLISNSFDEIVEIIATAIKTMIMGGER